MWLRISNMTTGILGVFALPQKSGDYIVLPADVDDNGGTAYSISSNSSQISGTLRCA